MCHYATGTSYTFAYYRGDTQTTRSLSVKLLESMERVDNSGIFLSEFHHLRELQATEPDASMQFYTREYPELFENPPQVSASNIAVAVSLADWMQRWGDRQTADLLLEMALSVTREAGCFIYLGAAATIHQLRGETACAITSFHDAIDAGWRSTWWMWKRESNSGPLRDQPEFQSAIAKLEAEMATELAQLKEMEQDSHHRSLGA